MNTLGLFAGLLPLLIFVIVDSLAGLEVALITTLIMAFGECAYSWYYFKSLDEISMISILLVVIMGLMSYYKKSSTFIKFQPVLLGLFISTVLLISSLLGDPIMLSMFLKYGAHLPYPAGVSFEALKENTMYLALLSESNFFLGVYLTIHAALVAWAALKLNNWWWIAVRGLGFYFFIILAFATAILKVRVLQGNY